MRAGGYLHVPGPRARPPVFTLTSARAHSVLQLISDRPLLLLLLLRLLLLLLLLFCSFFVQNFLKNMIPEQKTCHPRPTGHQQNQQNQQNEGSVGLLFVQIIRKSKQISSLDRIRHSRRLFGSDSPVL